LSWYAQEQRDLPWRRTRSAYRIWLSEVMLQQTTVQTATPYYHAFLERYPTMRALAAAPLEDVLARWSGLGYYHRARNLYRAAQTLVREHGGRFPRKLEQALDVPGVGPYTARAVLSIAYGVPEAVVDGNVRRVLARLLALRGPEWLADSAYAAPAAELLDRNAPGDWNQALMELGATLCTPRRPACARCPLARWCRARAAGIQDSVPEKRVRRATQEVDLAAAVVERGGKVLLVRREPGPLMGGFWELPQTGLECRGLVDLAPELKRRFGLTVALGNAVASARHAITHRRIRACAYAARLVGPLPRRPGCFLWTKPSQLSELAVSSLTLKLLRQAGMRPVPGA
jgi:A/G-specific adenine glycosylase